MSDNHRILYKNKRVDSNELRRCREVEGIQLRKEKREIELYKRRNIGQVIETDQVNVAEQYTLSNWSCIKNDVIKNLYSIVEEEQLKATQMFKKLMLSIPNLPIYVAISTGIVPQLVKFLKNTTNSLLQFEAAWVLTNIAAGTSEQTRIVLEEGAVQIFINLLESPHTNIRQQAVWALGNIASDSAMCCNYVLNMGIMVPLLNLINNCTDVPMIRISVWALCNICRGTIGSPFHFNMVSPALSILAKLLCHWDTEVLYVVCWALSYLCDGPNERIQTVIDANICSTLVKLLMHTKQCVSYAALQVVGNIVAGDTFQIQVVLNCSILPNLYVLLKSSDQTIRKDTCGIISNIIARNENQIQAVLNENIFPIVINIMASGEFNIKKEAVRVIKNVTTGGTLEQIQYLVEKKCIPPLCNLLTIMDVKIIKLALKSLENILDMGKKLSKKTGGSNQYAALLEECYGLEKIECLLYHKNNDIYLMALGINEYFVNSDAQRLLI